MKNDLLLSIKELKGIPTKNRKDVICIINRLQKLVDKEEEVKKGFGKKKDFKLYRSAPHWKSYETKLNTQIK